MNSEQKDLLSREIESWLKEKGLITDGQSIEISLRILPPKPRVTIVLDGQNPEKTIEDIMLRMHRSVRTRMWNGINFANIHNLTDLLSLSVAEIMKWRNVGKLAITLLGEALEKEGFSDSYLVKDIRRCYGSDKLNLKTETNRAKVRTLENTDWEKMVQSLMKVRRRHTEMHLKIVALLQKADNTATDASSLFPNKIHGSCWKKHIHIINLRWSSSDLPYRMQFTPTPNGKSRWEGKIQIACCATL